jgi:hypothetical protein
MRTCRFKLLAILWFQKRLCILKIWSQFVYINGHAINFPISAPLKNVVISLPLSSFPFHSTQQNVKAERSSGMIVFHIPLLQL